MTLWFFGLFSFVVGFVFVLLCFVLERAHACVRPAGHLLGPQTPGWGGKKLALADDTVVMRAQPHVTNPLPGGAELVKKSMNAQVSCHSSRKSHMLDSGTCTPGWVQVLVPYFMIPRPWAGTCQTLSSPIYKMGNPDPSSPS